MRRAFTLIEIMVVVAIMAIMVSSAVISVRSGQDAARVKGATRDIMAAIRHARSIALVMMQPAVITYSNERVDDEVCAHVKVDGAKLIGDNSSETVQTLSGETVLRDGTKVNDIKKSSVVDDEAKDILSDNEGDSTEDVLFAPMSKEVVKGVRLKVITGDDLISPEGKEQKKPGGISVFSNVDYLLGKYKEQKAAEKKAEEEKKADSDEEQMSSAVDDDQAPVSLVWEANGRCDPHRVWVYLDGKKPESGLCIKVDRFGAAKVLSGEENE